MKVKKANFWIGVLQMILVFIGAAGTVYSFITSIINGSEFVQSLIALICYILTILFTTWGYKKQGNKFLKYAIWCFAAVIAVGIIANRTAMITLNVTLLVAILGLICYMSGRMRRYKFWCIASGIVMVILLFTTINSQVQFIGYGAKPDTDMIASPSEIEPPANGEGNLELAQITPTDIPADMSDEGPEGVPSGNDGDPNSPGNHEEPANNTLNTATKVFNYITLYNSEILWGLICCVYLFRHHQYKAEEFDPEQ